MLVLIVIVGPRTKPFLSTQTEHYTNERIKNSKDAVWRSVIESMSEHIFILGAILGPLDWMYHMSLVVFWNPWDRPKIKSNLVLVFRAHSAMKPNQGKEGWCNISFNDVYLFLAINTDQIMEKSFQMSLFYLFLLTDSYWFSSSNI